MDSLRRNGINLGVPSLCAAASLSLTFSLTLPLQPGELQTDPPRLLPRRHRVGRGALSAGVPGGFGGGTLRGRESQRAVADSRKTLGADSALT